MYIWWMDCLWNGYVNLFCRFYSTIMAIKLLCVWTPWDFNHGYNFLVGYHMVYCDCNYKTRGLIVFRLVFTRKLAFVVDLNFLCNCWMDYVKIQRFCYLYVIVLSTELQRLRRASAAACWLLQISLILHTVPVFFR
jgi:hypothetical protein